MLSKTTGLARFYHASRYTLKGIKAAYQTEPAFRYESWMTLVLLPVAFWLAQTGLQFALLVSALLFVLIVELINTAVEAIVDRVSTEFHVLAGLAKDVGSAAVFLALMIALFIWCGIAWDNLYVRW